MQTNFRKDGKWIIGFVFTSFLLVAIITNFSFRDLELQFHDNYFVISSFNAFMYLAVFMYIIRGLYLLVDLMTDRYKILAFVIAFVNPIVILLMIVLFYFSVQNILILKRGYPQISLINSVIPILLLFGVIIIQIIVEVKSVLKVYSFLRKE